MLAKELIIARHGEAWCNSGGFIGGRRGCRGLTDLGQQQLHRLGQRMSKQCPQRPIHALYTTGLRRSDESGAILAPYIGLDPVIVEDLAEQDYGTGDGRQWTDVVAEYGDIPALDADRPLAPGGETWREYIQRSTHTLEQLLAHHPGQRILIVGHGETVDAAFHYFMDLPATSRATVAMAVHNSGLTIWQQQPISWTKPNAGLRWTLIAHNDTWHLVDDQT